METTDRRRQAAEVIVTAALGLLLCMATYAIEYIPLRFPFDIVLIRLALSALFVLYLSKIRLLSLLEFSPKNFGHGLACSAAFLLFSAWVLALNLLSVWSDLSWQVVELFCQMLMVGALEELIFRGGLLNTMIRAGRQTTSGLYAAAALSSLVFALCHYMNLVYTPFLETTVQVYNAFCLGLLFCAVYLRCKNLWVCVSLHTLWNFANAVGLLAPDPEPGSDIIAEQAAVSMTAWNFLFQLIEPTLFLLLALFVMRRVGVKADNEKEQPV